jgi:hypothetical protein
MASVITASSRWPADESQSKHYYARLGQGFASKGVIEEFEVYVRHKVQNTP